MIETLGGAFLIALMRITDVTIGTFRTIMVVQGRKSDCVAEQVVHIIHVLNYVTHSKNPD